MFDGYFREWLQFLDEQEEEGRLEEGEMLKTYKRIFEEEGEKP